jgi:RNA polymerase primary sigma factor
MKRIRKRSSRIEIPPLKPLEEKELLKIAQTTKTEKERLEKELEEIKDLTQKERKKIQQTVKNLEQERGCAVRLLVHHNRPLVEHIVNGYFSRAGGVDREDLVSEGNISLIKAIELFDLNSPNVFATYAGYWIHQKIQSFFTKNQLISQSFSAKEKKNLVYYDKEYQQNDKDNQSYSLIERLDDSEDSALSNSQVLQKETEFQIGNLINSLSSREERLVIRLYQHIKPRNLADVYHLAEDSEKEVLKEELKIKKTVSFMNLSERKYQNSLIVKKYLDMFDQKYTISKLAQLINKPESSVSKWKNSAFRRLEELARKKNLYCLLK